MDIYALGALLYSILTQDRPFEGNAREIMIKTLAGNLIPPIERSQIRQIPESLNAVVMKAMALNPADRYKSVQALIEDVRKYLDGYATLAENAGALKEITLSMRGSNIMSGLCIVSYGSCCCNDHFHKLPERV